MGILKNKYIWVLALAGILYIIAGLVFKANEASDTVKPTKEKQEEPKRIPLTSIKNLKYP